MSVRTENAALAASIDDARLKFDALSMALHWTTVLLILLQFATAWSIDRVEPSIAPMVLTAHRSAGVVLWALVALRLLWRATGMRKPPLPSSMKQGHRLGVRLGEYALYTLLMVQPITGLVDSIYRGKAFNILVFKLPALVHRDRDFAHLAHTAHEAGAYLLAALVGLHAMAALVHHFALKDHVLSSMLPGQDARQGRPAHDAA